MSKEQRTDVYVVRCDGLYAEQVNFLTFSVGRWTKCQRCAQRMTRQQAHAFHRGRPAWSVKRIVPREE